jgi:hypothetical protein
MTTTTDAVRATAGAVDCRAMCVSVGHRVAEGATGRVRAALDDQDALPGHGNAPAGGK